MTHRFPENPILSPSMVTPSMKGLEVSCTINPAAFVFDGRVWLVVRVAERPTPREDKTMAAVYDEQGALRVLAFDNTDPDLDLSDSRAILHRGKLYLSTLSHFRLFCSDDGVHFREDRTAPFITGSGPLETFGIEDCRVARINDVFHMTFTGVSENGVGVQMMSTVDWRRFERHGMILPPHNKDCALFEEPIGGKYACLHRPSGSGMGGHFIWLASSPDLVHWGDHVCLARTRQGQWDSERIGAGASPIRTDAGWVVLYHGASAGSRYCLGALLLDAGNPSRVIARSTHPIMEPVESYETSGFFGEVVFSNGHLVSGDEVIVYYGAADRVVCGARLSLNDVLAHLDPV